MGLFSPWFLAGLAALGLPLWLHLLRQFKRTPQPFSSLMFFERQIQSSSKHRRLRYLTLLTMRMALLALLALLFANPFVRRSANAVTSRQLTVIAIDQSFSMRYRNHLADAKEQATRFVDGLPGGRSYQVMELGAHLVTCMQPGSDKNAVRDAIRMIEFSDEASSYGEFSRALRVMEQSTGLNLDVHLFTDAQQTSMPAAFSDLETGPHTTLTIHQIGQGAGRNWAVESVSAPERSYTAANVKVSAGIAGWQTSDAKKKVSVLLDGRTLASKDVLVPASGRSDVEFDDLALPYGMHRGEVQIEPHDELPDDDVFSFAIERLDPRKVLFLYNGNRSAESFFFKSALDASASTGLQVVPESFGSAGDMDLTSYALVALNNPGELSPQVSQRLSEYVAKGGSLLIGVGPSTSAAGTVAVAGNKVSATTIMQGAGAGLAEFLPAGVFDNVQFVGTPRVSTSAADRVMARFADGTPLLLERTLGEGKLMIFASALDNSTSDFPVHASFLPFVAATCTYLSDSVGAPSSVVVGSAVSLRKSKDLSATADVIGPDGRHDIPLSEATRAMVFNPLRTGFYDVHPASGKRMLVAVNADRRESNLTQVPAETLILWRNTGRSGLTAAETSATTTVVPFSLWRYILGLLLIAAIVESIFATRYLSEERQAT